MSAVYQGREKVRCSPDAPYLAIGLPMRPTGPVEFFMSLFQALPPLNVKTAYIVQKGMLAGPARNSILQTVLERGIRYVLFLDDDVLFPDVTMYRLWVHMQLHPEAAAITGIYCTKVPPPEPFLYADNSTGAYWDWPLGALVPIHSAGAGCMIVDTTYLKNLTPPWFNDTVTSGADATGINTSGVVGHDRFFLSRLRDEGGGVVYADTGLLLGHMDIQTGRIVIPPPEAPCFQRPVVGESFIPSIDEHGVIMWTRVLPPEGNADFKGYLEWLKGQTRQESRQATVASTEPGGAS